MNQYLDEIDQQVAAKHLLHHPFYLAGAQRANKEALTDYARQCYHHMALPTYLSAAHEAMMESREKCSTIWSTKRLVAKSSVC
jgi:pyrroloquinoline quinone (PQQ) biosynthesis protein C